MALDFFYVRVKTASAEREREREREREILINGITNERTNIGKDERTFVSRKCNQKYRQSFKQFGSVVPDLGPYCLQTKNDRDDAHHPSPYGNPLKCT